MRLLMMFGPMAYRMYSKWSAKNKRQSVDQPQAHTEQMPKEGEVDIKYKDKDVKYDGDEFV